MVCLAHEQLDLNPLGYYALSVVGRGANKARYSSVTSLRTAIQAAFPNMDSALLKSSCERFRTGMEAVIADNLLSDFTLEILF